MAKSKERQPVLYSISQVQAVTGVAKSTIRFWEKEFSQYLTPHRTAGNQRRYDTRAIDVIRNIDRLVNQEGYTLEGARRRLAELQSGDDETAAVSGSRISEVAETMSDYLLKKLFQQLRARQVQSSENH